MPDNFDVKFKALPPNLQMRLWVLALDANTSKVNLAYSPGYFRTSLTYNYGGNAEASLGIRRYSMTVGFNPANQDVNLKLGLVYRGFSFQAAASPMQGSGSLGLTYGRKLLPFPDELAPIFNAANGGLMSMAGDISSAPNNPLAWYKLHSDDVGAIGKAVDLGRKIADQDKSSSRFGVGLRLNYSQPTGLTIYGAAGLYF